MKQQQAVYQMWRLGACARKKNKNKKNNCAALGTAHCPLPAPPPYPKQLIHKKPILPGGYWGPFWRPLVSGKPALARLPLKEEYIHEMTRER